MDSETLYVGNATRQTCMFSYCVIKGGTPRTQSIPPGAQVRISGDLLPSQVDYIVRQHAKYGIIAADAANQARGFRGICYSIGKPIAAVKLTMLLETNHSALVAAGREIREQNAVAQSGVIDQVLAENDRPEALKSMEFTIQQEERDPNNSEPQFSEGFRVIRGGADQSPTPSRRGRRRAA